MRLLELSFWRQPADPIKSKIIIAEIIFFIFSIPSGELNRTPVSALEWKQGSIRSLGF
jgi:hypothetical protein